MRLCECPVTGVRYVLDGAGCWSLYEGKAYFWFKTRGQWRGHGFFNEILDECVLKLLLDPEADVELRILEPCDMKGKGLH